MLHGGRVTELRQVVESFTSWRTPEILADTWLLMKGEKFLVVATDHAWWTILTQAGLRYVWFTEFENSEVLEVEDCS